LPAGPVDACFRLPEALATWVMTGDSITQGV
jgi:hypothetical protein